MEPIHVHIPYPRMKDLCELMRLRRYDLEIYMSAAVLDQVEKTDLENLCRSLDWKPSISLLRRSWTSIQALWIPWSGR